MLPGHRCQGIPRGKAYGLAGLSLLYRFSVRLLYVLFLLKSSLHLKQTCPLYTEQRDVCGLYQYIYAKESDHLGCKYIGKPPYNGLHSIVEIPPGPHSPQGLLYVGILFVYVRG